MDRQKVLEFLENQLKKLKEEEHVEDLMKHGLVDELKQVVKELDFSTLDEFCNNTGLELEDHETPVADYFYETIFYFMHSNFDDDQIFKDYNSIVTLAEKKGEELATKIGNQMYMRDLKDIEIEDLV